MQVRPLLTLLLVSVFAATPSYAWDWYHPSVEVELKESAVVCVGTLISTRTLIDKDGFYSGTFFSIRVKEMLKGSPASTVELYCDNDSGRFSIEAGKDYLIFASYESNFDGVTGSHLNINDGGNYGALPKANKALALVRHMLNMPNQSTDPTPASGTPPAGQESRHP